MNIFKGLKMMTLLVLQLAVGLFGKELHELNSKELEVVTTVALERVEASEKRKVLKDF